MAHYSLPSHGDDDPGARIPRRYAWVVFALSFGLLLSDYMSRQVLNAVFPLLKAEWALSDARLGLLSGIVALMIGLLTFPLSLLADRFGRVRSLALMAVVEPGHACLRPGAGLSADARGALPRRRWRSGLRQCRHCRRAVGVPETHARDLDRCLHGWRHVRLRAGHGPRRRRGRAPGLAVGLRRHGRVRP